jgi:hypothetical protein
LLLLKRASSREPNCLTMAASRRSDPRTINRER